PIDHEILRPVAGSTGAEVAPVAPLNATTRMPLSPSSYTRHVRPAASVTAAPKLSLAPVDCEKEACSEIDAGPAHARAAVRHRAKPRSLFFIWMGPPERKMPSFTR